jgi:hypothetical protein
MGELGPDEMPDALVTTDAFCCLGVQRCHCSGAEWLLRRWLVISFSLESGNCIVIGYRQGKWGRRDGDVFVGARAVETLSTQS